MSRRPGIICVRCPPNLADQLNKIDSYLRQYIDNIPGRLFNGKTVTYKPLLVPQEDEYDPRIRCNINTAGQKAVRCWDADQARRDLPEDVGPRTLVPRVQFQSLWLMGDNCGVSVDVTDLMVFPIDDECPFPMENKC